jgi:hypothetical protein
MRNARIIKLPIEGSKKNGMVICENEFLADKDPLIVFINMGTSMIMYRALKLSFPSC